MKIELANRIRNLPPYLFAEVDRLKGEQIKKGVDVIDLGVGDPDQPTPRFIIEELQKRSEDPANHQYPSYSGMNLFREAVARWMQKRFDVKLDPTSEIVSLIGSKEGISNIPYAFVNPGDVVLIPSPGYPPYTSGTLFCSGEPYSLPLKRENGFLPDLKAIPEEVAVRSKILHIKYQNNPTAAVATNEFFKQVVDFAKKYKIIVASDAAYSEIYFDEKEKPKSFLETPGAMEVGIEFHSLSKTFNMTGWRIGWACGHPEIIAGLGKVKTNVDSGVFHPIQYAGMIALEKGDEAMREIRQLYKTRHTLFVQGLKKIGFDVASAQATFYVWVAVPKGETSKTFAVKLLEKAGIVVTPGNGFGDGGEGYIRFSLTKEEARLKEALDRLKKFLG
ncbi:MAG: LL-diaminopimelate aminotransferase [Deltaproteobacteria bacterium]|nr:LL-diaminopimelate aminotransferase [Deltaproteobacteria bacterium]